MGKSAFVEEMGTNSLDVTFLLVSYKNSSSVMLGVCPIASYERNKAKDYQNCLGNKGFKGSIAYNVYTGNFRRDGKESSGGSKAKAGDKIRITLDEGNLH